FIHPVNNLKRALTRKVTRKSDNSTHPNAPPFSNYFVPIGVAVTASLEVKTLAISRMAARFSPPSAVLVEGRLALCPSTPELRATRVPSFRLVLGDPARSESSARCRGYYT